MPDVAAPAATADHLLLFNRDDFHALNLRPGQRTVRVDHHDGGRLVGSLVGVRDGDVVTCGHSAPFGGPDLVRDAETASNVVALVARAVSELEADGVRTIRVRCRPAFCSASETTVQFALLNQGFRVEACELGFHIDLSGLDGIGAYVAGLRSPARRALRHGLAEPFALRDAGAGDPWDAGYAILAANRAAKGRRLALDAGYVRAARDTFPGRVRMAVLEPAGRPCAAALPYRVLPGREEAFLREVDELLGPDVEREWVTDLPAVETPFEGALTDAMQAALRTEDPTAEIVPYMLSGGTDAKAFSTLGMKCYGFAPLRLPPELDFASLFHGIDERVPVDALRFGTRVLDRFLRTA